MLKGINKLVVGLVVVLIAFTGCKDDGEDWRLQAEVERLDNYMARYYPDVVKDEYGIFHITETVGTGEGVTDGQFVYINFTSEIIYGDIYESTIADVAQENGFYLDRAPYMPRIVAVDIDQTLDGIYYSLLSMKVGDKTSFVFPSSLGFYEETSESVPVYSSLKITMELFSVFDEPKDFEFELISKYMEDNSLLMTFDTEDLYEYLILEEGDSIPVEAGSDVKVNYVGKYLNNKIFDTNLEDTAYVYGFWDPNRSYDAFEFTNGDQSVISGWELGSTKLQMGSEAIFIFPSDLGYGEAGSGNIPGYTPLLFYIQVLEVSESTDEDTEL